MFMKMLGSSLNSGWLKNSNCSLLSQVAVTMYLLYRQVGLSCLVGVAIAVIMIPLNKYVADKIGAMSTKMMTAKDERVKLMSEVLHGVRSIKFCAWEEYFLGRVGRCRNQELKYLKGRKYLDAGEITIHSSVISDHFNMYLISVILQCAFISGPRLRCSFPS